MDVAVDPETGKVDVLRFTIAQEMPERPYTRPMWRGRCKEAAVQGIGWGLNEEYFYNNKGEMTNGSFLDYRMPTRLDMPMIDTVIVEVPNPGHPFGVRGMGEVSIVPPPPALANAIYDAIGVRMRRLPMNPAVAMDAIWQQKQEK